MRNRVFPFCSRRTWEREASVTRPRRPSKKRSFCRKRDLFCILLFLFLLAPSGTFSFEKWKVVASLPEGRMDSERIQCRRVPATHRAGPSREKPFSHKACSYETFTFHVGAAAAWKNLFKLRVLLLKISFWRSSRSILCTVFMQIFKVWLLCFEQKKHS